MRTATIGCLVVALAGIAEGRPKAAAEAPRATLLLQAERLAEEAQRRLELPRSRTPGWRRGGQGWDQEEHAAPPGHVTIRVPRPRPMRK